MSSPEQRRRMIELAQQNIDHLEVDEFTVDSIIDSGGRYVTIYCYGDTLEFSGYAYPTISDALNTLTGITGGTAPWGLLDLDANGIQTAYIPIELTATAGTPTHLADTPTPDH